MMVRCLGLCMFLVGLGSVYDDGCGSNVRHDSTGLINRVT